MSNPLDSNTHKGTLGEILVQLNLLKYNIESFPPLKDSGNDLIAYFRNKFKSIQVKTKKDGKQWAEIKDRKYDILALVDLDENLSLDKSKIWLLTKKEAEKNEKDINNCSVDDKFLLTEKRINKLKD